MAVHTVLHSQGVGQPITIERRDKMRNSNDQYRAGQLYNGFDYDLQVWVKQGIILDCGHNDKIAPFSYSCCNAKKYKGEKITNVRASLGM